MELNVAFTQGSSPTQPTILRSTSFDYLVYLCTYQVISLHRVLLATIRDQGLCPCPRCILPKVDLDRLGTKQEMDSRNNGKCIRGYIRSKVIMARTWIYQMGDGITSAMIERLLKPLSLVPTLVCSRFPYQLPLLIAILFNTERFCGTSDSRET